MFLGSTNRFEPQVSVYVQRLWLTIVHDSSFLAIGSETFLQICSKLLLHLNLNKKKYMGYIAFFYTYIKIDIYYIYNICWISNIERVKGTRDIVRYAVFRKSSPQQNRHICLRGGPGRVQLRPLTSSLCVFGTKMLYKIKDI